MPNTNVAPIEVPDTPTPKDVALMYLDSVRDKFKREIPKEDIMEFVRAAGWPQYTCGEKRAIAVAEQLSKAIDRMYERVVDAPLKKRGIK